MKEKKGRARTVPLTPPPWTVVSSYRCTVNHRLRLHQQTSRTTWSPRQTVFLPVTVFLDRGPFLSLSSFSLHPESSSSPQVIVPSPRSQQLTAVSPYFRLHATSPRRDHDAVIKTLTSPRLPSVDGSSSAPLSPRHHTVAPSPKVSLSVISPSTVPFVETTTTIDSADHHLPITVKSPSSLFSLSRRFLRYSFPLRVFLFLFPSSISLLSILSLWKTSAPLPQSRDLRRKPRLSPVLFFSLRASPSLFGIFAFFSLDSDGNGAGEGRMKIRVLRFLLYFLFYPFYLICFFLKIKTFQIMSHTYPF